MNLLFQDKGKYFRGLLILIGKDDIIHYKEKNIILQICEKLGFEPKFCDEAVDTFLGNNYVETDPPKFSEKEIAESFLKDAIKLSLVDDNIHIDELGWLKSVAAENSISNNWLEKELQSQAANFNKKEFII
jgi:hypothetical protein